MGKSIYTEVERAVNHDTGEITSTTTTNVVKLPKEPPYVKMYIDDLCGLINIGKAPQDVLWYLLKKLDYEGYITISTRFRKVICDGLGIKEQTLRNRLVALTKTGVITNTGTNEYQANPDYFARGEWAQIIEQRREFKITISYSEAGRKIKAE